MMLQNPDPKRHLQVLLRINFAAFAEKVFATISPGKTYHHNWHIDAIAHQLSEVADGRCRRLVITIPPRSLKSTIIPKAPDADAWSL